MRNCRRTKIHPCIFHAHSRKTEQLEFIYDAQIRNDQAKRNAKMVNGENVCPHEEVETLTRGDL